MKKAIAHLRKADPVMAEIIERIGPCNLTYRDPCFESMVRSIVFQQLHGSAARTIFERLRAACLAALTPAPMASAGAENGSTAVVPAITPDSILALTDEQMRAVGLSKQKMSYIRDLAARTHSGEIDFARLPDMDDEDVIEHLTRVKGIGRWSAQMFLIFALRRTDVMPTADFGVNMAIKKAYKKRKVPKPAQILKMAERWAPYRSVACWYLWRVQELPVAKPAKKAAGKAARKRTRG